MGDRRKSLLRIIGSSPRFLAAHLPEKGTIVRSGWSIYEDRLKRAMSGKCNRDCIRVGWQPGATYFPPAGLRNHTDGSSKRGREEIRMRQKDLRTCHGSGYQPVNA